MGNPWKVLCLVARECIAGSDQASGATKFVNVIVSLATISGVLWLPSFVKVFGYDIGSLASGFAVTTLVLLVAAYRLANALVEQDDEVFNAFGISDAVIKRSTPGRGSPSSYEFTIYFQNKGTKRLYYKLLHGWVGTSPEQGLEMPITRKEWSDIERESERVQMWMFDIDGTMAVELWVEVAYAIRPNSKHFHRAKRAWRIDSGLPKLIDWENRMIRLPNLDTPSAPVTIPEP